MRKSHTLTEQRIIRGYEFLWLGYVIIAAIVLIASDFAYSAIVVMGFAGIAVVFAGMMDVLPEIVEHL